MVASPSRTSRRPICPVAGSMTGKASMFSIREPRTWLNEVGAGADRDCHHEGHEGHEGLGGRKALSSGGAAGMDGAEEEVGMEFDALSNRVIGCALEVHRALGPGLLESSYEQCLAYELSLAKIAFELQRPLPIDYKGIRLDCGYRVDVLVEDALILELKAVDALLPIHEAQLLTYLRLSGKRTGILINFNVELLKRGIKRMVL